MKRLIAVGTLCISIFVFCVLSLITNEKVPFSDLQVSSENFEKIKADRSKTDLDLLKKISFDNTPLFYDELTSSWFCSVSPEQSDADPSVTYKGTAKDLKLAVSGEMLPGNTIPMIVYTEKEYREYRLAITPLPLIRIECDEDDFPPFVEGGFPPFAERLDFRIRFTMIDNRPSVLRKIIRSDGRFHVRGSGSATYEKTGFRLTLFEKAGGKELHENRTPLLGLRADGDWLLYSGYNDQEKVRNVFSSNLWLSSCGSENSYGLKNGNEYRYVELFLNNKYWGLYAIGYPIDAEQMRIFPNLKGEYDEYLFKQTGWGPNDGSSSAGDDRLEIQMDAKESEVNYGYSILKMYFDYLNAGAEYGLAHNDMDNAVDIWLFLKLIQADDSISPWRNSINNIFYTIKSSAEGKKILYTPWDMDRSWGNTVDDTLPNSTGAYVLRADNNRYEMRFSPVSIMLRSGNDITERVRKRYEELRADGWSDKTVGEMIDFCEAEIFASGAYLREMERWPDGSYIDPALGLSLFRTYVFDRFRSMDAYIADL